MKATKYTYDTDPQKIFDCVGQTGFYDDKIIKAAGFDPKDEEIQCFDLCADWKKHKAGSVLVTGSTVEGHSFAIVEDY